MFEEEKNFKNSKAKLLTNKKILEYFTNVLIPKLSDTNNNYKFLKKVNSLEEFIQEKNIISIKKIDKKLKKLNISQDLKEILLYHLETIRITEKGKIYQKLNSNILDLYKHQGEQLIIKNEEPQYKIRFEEVQKGKFQMMRIEDYKGNNLIDYSVDLGEESKGSKIFGSFKEKAGILFQTYNQILKHYNQK